MNRQIKLNLIINDYHIKTYLEILYLLGIDIKLDISNSDIVFVNSISLNESILDENDIGNYPNVVFNPTDFLMNLDENFIFIKPNFCDFQNEIFNKNPHLNINQVEQMYEEYVEELDERADTFTKDFIHEVNTNLKQLQKVINTYKLQGENDG